MIEEIKSVLNKRIEKILASFKYEGELIDAAKYMLLSSGKRVRPLACLSLCEDLGGEPEKFVDPALSLEVIHTASLIHDDLPAIDDDDYRRGKKSCHAEFSEATAILTGDFLVSFITSGIASFFFMLF